MACQLVPEVSGAEFEPWVASLHSNDAEYSQVIADVDCGRCARVRGSSNDKSEEESGIIADEFRGPEGQHVKYMDKLVGATVNEVPARMNGARTVEEVIADVDCGRCARVRGSSNDKSEEESGIIADEFRGPEGQHVKYMDKLVGATVNEVPARMNGARTVEEVKAKI
ncbi:hypothetical protein OG21DRAFT_1526971 [Imleria badia]|nr:hypothetical protein OG21DRAFT_1526971 [Imleria badia]